MDYFNAERLRRSDTVSLNDLSLSNQIVHSARPLGELNSGSNISNVRLHDVPTFERNEGSEAS